MESSRDFEKLTGLSNLTGASDVMILRPYDFQKAILVHVIRLCSPYLGHR